MTAQLVRVQRARSDALMVVGLGADLAVIRKNMVRMNLSIPLYTLAGGITPPYVEGAGDLVLGTRGSSFGKIARDPLPPETKAFIDAYKAKYGADRWWGPDPNTPHPAMAGTIGTGYDCAALLCDAFKRAGGTEAGAVIKALEATKDFPGANGTYTFSATQHDAIRPADLGLYEYVKADGRIELKPTKG
jgi:branched-chain amino acid transport system substrate-binding protein